MADDMLYQLLAKVPPTATQATVTYVDAEGVTCVHWIGYTAEGAAMALYHMADEIVAQRIPPKAWVPPK